MRICVYGAASDKVDNLYKEIVEQLGETIATKQHQLIFGGGATGMMGAVSRGAFRQNGRVVGVVPSFMSTFEPISEDNPNLNVIHVETMAERKAVMEQNSDMFIITPGGIGTWDEFFQILTLKELGRVNPNCQILVLNINNYYTKLLEVLTDGMDAGFVRPTLRSMYEVCTSLEELEAYL